MLGQAIISLAKTESKWLRDWNELMTIVLEEWGLTTKFAELEIKNRSKRGLDAENLNLHHEKM